MNYYASRAEKLLTESKRKEVVDILAVNPLAGDIIQEAFFDFALETRFIAW